MKTASYTLNEIVPLRDNAFSMSLPTRILVQMEF